MAFDEANHRLFVVMRNPGKLIVLNSDNGKAIANLPAVGLGDDASYDAQHKRIYLAGDGFLDVFEQRDADHYALLAKIPGAFWAKTAFWYPNSIATIWQSLIMPARKPKFVSMTFSPKSPGIPVNYATM